MIIRSYFFNAVIISLIMIVIVTSATACSQSNSKIDGHVTIAKQVTSTKDWMQGPIQGPIPPEYQYLIIKVDVKNNNYLTICPTWPHILNEWVITNDNPSYPKELYPIYCRDYEVLSTNECIREGKSGQFMVLYAVPPVKNFSDIHLVYTTGYTWNPDTSVNLILDTIVSSYDWDTKTITDPTYKPPKGFPTALVLAIVIVALVLAAPPVYLTIKRSRRDAQARKEQQESREREERMKGMLEGAPAGVSERIQQEIGGDGLEASPSSKVYEGDIQEFIVENIGMLENGLQVEAEHRKIHDEHNKVIGEIDILCKDTNGVYVVVELKRNKAGDKVAGQISRYLTWVDRNLAKGVTPRGIIVASVKDIKLEHAIGAIKYNIEIREFHDSPPTKENVKYCGSCGTPNPKSSEYCQACRAKFWMQ